MTTSEGNIFPFGDDSSMRMVAGRHDMLAACLARTACVVAIASVVWAPRSTGELFSAARGLAAGAVGLITLLVLLRSDATTSRDNAPGVSPGYRAPRVRALVVPALLLAGALAAVALAGGWSGPLAILMLVPALILDTALGGCGALLLGGIISVAGSVLVLCAEPNAVLTTWSASRLSAASATPATWAALAGLVFWLRVLLAERRPASAPVVWRELGTPRFTSVHVLAQASHELLTPLAAIQAGAGLLVEPTGVLTGASTPPGSANAPDPFPSRRVAGNVWRNAARLNLLIEDVLELARWNERPPRLEAGWHACAKAQRRATDAVALLCESRSQRVSWVTTPSELHYWGDARRMEQVLLNLLANAHKYAGERACITVVARSWEEGVRWEVHDDGPGLDEQSLTRVFDPYYRTTDHAQGYVDPPSSASGTDTEEGGHGLGLAIVSALVALHGGSLWAENNRTGGCQFVIWLPGCRDGSTDEWSANADTGEVVQGASSSEEAEI